MHQPSIVRVPPHDLDAEQVVLAACLMDTQSMAVAVETLAPADFYRAAHGHIFEAMQSLHRSGRPVDLYTLRDALGRMEKLDDVGGFGYLVDLTEHIPTTAYTGHYAEIVWKKARRREALDIHHQAIVALYDPESADPTTEALGRLMAIRTHREADASAELGDLVGDRLDEIQAAMEGRGRELRSFETGLPDIDYKVMVTDEDMVVVGARPSAGKTSFGLQVMDTVAARKRVLFYSLEMPKKRIVARYLALKTGISVQRQDAGRVTKDEMEMLSKVYRETLANRRLHIDDRTGLTVAQMFAKAQRLMATDDPPGLIVIDHLIKVKPADARASRHQQMAQISADIKEMNRRLKVPVLALMQLNRASEKENREPQMSDLRESGSLEEDADVVLLLHRPEREGSMTDAKLGIAKNRNGECGSVTLKFDGERMRFACIEHRVEDTHQWQ